MQKQMKSKKRSSKATARREKVAPTMKKRRVNAKGKKTVLAKLKNAFDETAAKLKTLLPGESKQPDRDANEMA
jgi:hypothetical protein